MLIVLHFLCKMMLNMPVNKLIFVTLINDLENGNLFLCKRHSFKLFNTYQHEIPLSMLTIKVPFDLFITVRKLIVQ